jgi:nucleoside-diphosphate-sugar epimerase
VNGKITTQADVTNATRANEVIQGSSVVVLCVGLQYDLRIWQQQWPVIMQNTINACIKYNAKLIFFDNCYMLGRVQGPMTENTPYNPVSKKGELRAQLATELMEAATSGNLKALIARSADFYGPGCKTSMLNTLVFDKMAKGKNAQWMINDNALHSFTFTPDCGKAICMLAESERSWNQVWHMPTAKPALTGKQLIHIAAQIFNVGERHSIIGKRTISALAIFMRLMYEMKEMLYQYDADYIFDSSKFNAAFNFTPTPYHEGFEITAKSYQTM